MRIAVLVPLLWACSSSEQGRAGDAASDGIGSIARELPLGAARVKAGVCACGLCEEEPSSGTSSECVANVLEDEAGVTTGLLGCYVERLRELEGCVSDAACDASELSRCPQAVGERECELFPVALMRGLAACGGVSACVLNPAACIPAEFECGDGERVPLGWRCNFNVDCVDESDEADCSDQAFVCSDGREIPRAWRCDLQEDCAEGEDELDCT